MQRRMTKIQWEIITKAVPLELMSTGMRKMRRTRTTMRKISNSMELMPVRTSMQREEGKERRRERKRGGEKEKVQFLDQVSDAFTL